MDHAVQPALDNEMAKHALGRRRTADVAHADEQYGCPGFDISHVGVFLSVTLSVENCTQRFHAARVGDNVAERNRVPARPAAIL
jgi:hypothetical protein